MTGSYSPLSRLISRGRLNPRKEPYIFYLIYTQMPTAMDTRVNTAVWLETAHQQNCSFIGGILDT